MIHNRSIICFGGEDWWYHHPHQSEHLMRRFARAGNKVIFVNSISMGLPALAHKDLLARIARKLRSYARFAREEAEGITVVSPPTIPFFGSQLARRANRFLLSVQIRELAKRRSFASPILWISIPTAVDMVGRLNESLVIYLVGDKYDANTMDHATDSAVIKCLHERAIDAADIIFYSGRKMFTEAERGSESSFLLEQAVDFEHFSQVADSAVEVAPEVARIPRPRLGYFGAIEPWLIDQELIKQAAVEQPEWNWIFLGNKSRGLKIESLPNAHFLPPVSYCELPRYAAGFDVCVLPWDIENVWTSYAAPLKVREYLATGKPVVIAQLAEFEAMQDVLSIARNRDDFLRLVQHALDESGEEAARVRQASVAGNTWDARAEWVSDLIERKLAEKEN